MSKNKIIHSDCPNGCETLNYLSDDLNEYTCCHCFVVWNRYTNRITNVNSANVVVNELPKILKTERLDFKVSVEQKELIQLASTIKGSKSTSEFIVDILMRYSKEIINEHQSIKKIIVHRKHFIQEITNKS